MATPMTEAEAIGLMDSLSNWGRWGAEDELGTLNFVTPEKRKAAAALVREGVTVSCAWDIENTPQPDHAFGTPQRYMVASGEGWHDPREDGLVPDIYIAMGQTAENLAKQRGLTREELDEFGVRSQNLAEKAIADGFWAREITPVTTPDGTEVSADDGPRAGVTLEAAADLKPVFRPDGVVTAANCCPVVTSTR